MAEQRVVKATLQRFECSRVPNLDYFLDVSSLKSTKAFLTLNKETLNTSHNNISGAVKKVVNSQGAKVFCSGFSRSHPCNKTTLMGLMAP